jgi:glucan-binding YG repeat protein
MNSENVYYNVDESGWHYLQMDLSDFENVDLTYSSPFDADPSDGKTGETDEFFITIIFHKSINNILWQTNGSINGPFTYYIDNITVDYSEVVDDRESPIFESVVLSDKTGNKTLGKHDCGTATSNLLNLSVGVAEATYRVDGTGTKHSLTNYTGLNVASAKAYVDGVEVKCNFANGQMSISNVAVADGFHRVKFEICDNAGNMATLVRLVEVRSGVKASSVSLTPADPDLVAKDRIDFGSIFWMNLNATNIETIQKIETVIDLNSVNHWQLDNMVLADGFSAEYTVDAETNTAVITFTRTGNNYQVGSAILAQIPIRIIYFDTDMKIPGYTAETVWTKYNFWPHDLKVDVDMGKITYVDGYASDVIGTFSNEKFRVNTEMYTDFQSMGSDPYFTEHGTTHVHTPVALEDKPSTCTQPGYTGRIFCSVCDSVVEWGTTVPATSGEHTYDTVEGIFMCTVCGDILTGVYNGVTYDKGIAITTGWNADRTSYYKDGVKVTGSHFIDGVMCTFDDNGVYLPDHIYDGFFEHEGKQMFFVNNEYLTGAQPLSNDFYYFDNNGFGYEGTFVICGETCYFAKGTYVSCDNPDVLDAGWCGKNVEYVVYSNGVLKLSGNGATYGYKNHGNRPFIDYLEMINKIEVGKDITVLNLNIFSYLLAKEVVFEEGSILYNISTGAFHTMPYLTELNIPATVTSIGAIAFKRSTGLRRINIPAGVKAISDTAFKNTSAALVYYVEEGSFAESYAKAKGWNYSNESFLRNGFYEDNGELYYYVNGVKHTERGLFKVDGIYYYAKNGGALLRNCVEWANVTNGLLPKARYTFDENGKILLKQGFIEEDGELYYYVDGTKRVERGLFKVDGNYYYSKTGGALLRNCVEWANVTNGLLPKARYTFDENGKIVL